MKSFIQLFVLLLIPFTLLNAQKVQKTVKNATINWTGHKIVGEHSGTIDLKTGTVVLRKDKISGGKFVIDMTTIATTDMEADMNEKLNKHLKNEDFFEVNKYKTATLEFKKIKTISKEKLQITANLTIKNITKKISFTLKVKNNTATADLKIDRTDFDVKYKSGKFFKELGNRAIKDNFDLSVSFSY